jgi:hypothetical protein
VYRNDFEYTAEWFERLKRTLKEGQPIDRFLLPRFWRILEYRFKANIKAQRIYRRFRKQQFIIPCQKPVRGPVRHTGLARKRLLRVAAQIHRRGEPRNGGTLTLTALLL